MLIFAGVAPLARSRAGVAAVEFALIAPALTLLLVGSLDVARGLILYQQVSNAAGTVPLTASLLAVQADKSTALTVAQVQLALSSIYAEVPQLRSGIETGMRSVTMTSVTFVQTNLMCVPSQAVACAAVPHVAWSVAYYGGNATGFQNVVRACGPLNQTAPTAGSPSDLTSIRTASVVNPTPILIVPTPILIVDVHYQFTPIFFDYLTGSIDFWASGCWPVRSAAANTTIAQQYTAYDPLNQAGGAGKCTGYP